MRQFRISFNIPAKLLGEVIGLIAQEGQDLQITELAGSQVVRGPDKAPRKTPARKSQTREALAEIFIDDKPHDLREVEDALERRGLARSTGSPLLSKYVAEGKLELIRRGTYKLNGSAI